MTELSELNTADLITLREEADQVLVSRRKSLVHNLAELISGNSVEDILTELQGVSPEAYTKVIEGCLALHRRRNKTSRKVIINPHDPQQVWNGYGRKPKWVIDLEEKSDSDWWSAGEEVSPDSNEELNSGPSNIS